MASTLEKNPLGDLPEAFLGLVRAQVKWSQDYFEAVTGAKLPSVPDTSRAFQRAVTYKPVCDVPAPCWMPLDLGDCKSHVGACDKACVRVVVTNCDRVERTVSIRADGDPGVKVEPSTVTLAPMQRVTVEVCRKVPEETETGQRFESVIWVEGCRQHFFRWTVSVGTAGVDSCHEVAVNDCPDYRHHWYDHFYCVRPCFPYRDAKDG